MKKMVFLAGALMLLASGSAMAAGTNLAWTDCLGAGGTTTRAQACTNSALVSNVLQVSFVLADPIPSLGASDGLVDVVTPNTMGSWWLGGSTRWGATPGPATCPGWADNAPNGPVPFGPNIVQMAPNRLRIRFVISVATGQEQAHDANSGELLAHAIQLKFNAGTFNNTECNAGAAMAVTNLTLQQPGGAPSTVFESPDVSNCVNWRSSALVCPGATPTDKASWGSIKALYR